MVEIPGVAGVVSVDQAEELWLKGIVHRDIKIKFSFELRLGPGLGLKAFPIGGPW